MTSTDGTNVSLTESEGTVNKLPFTGAKASVPVPLIQDTGQRHLKETSTVMSNAEEEQSGLSARPQYCQNRMQLLRAKVLLEDDDCGMEVDDLPRKKPAETRNAAGKLNFTTGDKVHKKKKQKKRELAKKEPVAAEARRKGLEDVKEEDDGDAKLAQRTNLGICVEDKELLNNTCNINMNLTMNSVEKELPGSQKHQQQQPQSASPYYAQYWSQTTAQPLPLAYGMLPGYNYSMQCPPPVVYPVMYAPPQPYMMPAFYPVPPTVPPTSTRETIKVVSNTEQMKRAEKVEVSTNTDCLLSDLSGIILASNEDNSGAAVGSKDDIRVKLAASAEQTPREKSGFSIDLGQTVHPMISRILTPRSGVLGKSPKVSSELNKCRHESISILSTSKEVEEARKDPYMQRLYQMHAPRLSLRENVLGSNSVLLNLAEVSTSSVMSPFDTTAPKPAVSFDVKEEGSETGTLADLFNSRKKSLRSRLESEKIKATSKVAHRSDNHERTKERILQIRREMMRPKNAREEASAIKEEQRDAENSDYEADSLEMKAATRAQDKSNVLGAKQKKVSSKLLTRLVEGSKPEITKAEMHRLTKKNYMQLPEVQEKANEERKKKELRERLKNAREMEKV